MGTDMDEDEVSRVTTVEALPTAVQMRGFSFDWQTGKINNRCTSKD